MDTRTIIISIASAIIGAAIGWWVVAPLLRDPCPQAVAPPDSAYRAVAERALHHAAQRDSINTVRLDSLRRIVDSLDQRTAPLPVLIDENIHATRDLGVDSLRRGLLRRPE